MIRIGATHAQVVSDVARDYPAWYADANARSAALVAGTGDRNLPSTWSGVKPYYMRLQGSKCMYCEKEVEDNPVEQDVEHYRPKKKVARWPIPKELANQGIHLTQPARGSEPGYPLLAYHPLNYGAACLTCNRILKKNYFPIAGTRNYAASDPAAIHREGPYLVYPIGDLDDDPEDVMEFAGLSPQAKGAGFRFQRALVTIWLFRLNRKWLQKDRAKEIIALYLALERRGRRPRDAMVGDAEKVIRHMTISPRARHANCMRSYRRLYEADPAAAERVFRACAKFVTKSSL